MDLKSLRKSNSIAAIKEENKVAAFNWVRDQGDGDIIKNIVSVDFKKGEDKVAQEFRKLAEDSGLVPNENSSIHPSTLKVVLECKIQRWSRL
jgi:hypothetical protein